MKKPGQLFSSLLKFGNTKYNNNLGGPAWVIPLTIGVFVASQALAGIVLGAILTLTRHGSSLSKISDVAWVQFLFVLFAEAVAVGLVLWLLKLRKVSLAKIGLGRLPGWSDLKSGLLGFGAYYLVLIVVLLAVSQLVPSLNLDQNQDIGFDRINDGMDKAFAFLSLVILAPIGEEVLMRGYLFSGLRGKLNFLPAMFITSLIFAAAHLEFGNGGPLVWAAALSTFVLSMVLVYKRETTGAIYAGILIHMLNNLVAFKVNF